MKTKLRSRLYQLKDRVNAALKRSTALYRSDYSIS